MRFGEIALFNFDAKSGQLLGPKAKVPQLPVQEVCMVFGSRYAARASASGQIAAHPQMLTVLYDRRGRWLSTRWREGETGRNPGLGLAWILLQFPLLAIYGTISVLALSAIGASYFGIEPIRIAEMSSQQLSNLFTGGFWSVVLAASCSNSYECGCSYGMEGQCWRRWDRPSARSCTGG